MADREGNVWIGRDRELAVMAHAAARTIVTVERLHDGNLLDDPHLAAGTLSGFYIESVAVAPQGAWPLGLADHYAADRAHLEEYVRLAAHHNLYVRPDRLKFGKQSASHACAPEHPVLCKHQDGIAVRAF